MSTAEIALLDRGNAQRPWDPFRKCDLPNTGLTVYLRAWKNSQRRLLWGSP